MTRPAVPFSIAEAIIDPFYDFHTSTFDQWEVAPAPDRKLKVWQDWDIVLYEWESAPPEGPALHMTRHVNLDCSRYDRMVLSLNAPVGAEVVLSAETDAGPRSVRSAPNDGKHLLLRLDLDGATRINRLVKVKSW